MKGAGIGSSLNTVPDNLGHFFNILSKDLVKRDESRFPLNALEIPNTITAPITLDIRVTMRLIH